MTRAPTRILFVCTYHGGRSRIAEAFMNEVSQGKAQAFASCFEPGELSPKFYQLAKEVGLDIPVETIPSVFERYKNNEPFDYVVTLCHQATTEQCPVFMTNIDALYAKKAKREQWSIVDLKNLGGTEEEWFERAREVRDSIKKLVLDLLERLEEEDEPQEPSIG